MCASFEHPALSVATQVGSVLRAPAPWTSRPGSMRSVEPAIRPLGGKVATRRKHADASRLRGSRCPCDRWGRGSSPKGRNRSLGVGPEVGPVLKHGPRSASCMQGDGILFPMYRNEHNRRGPRYPRRLLEARPLERRPPRPAKRGHSTPWRCGIVCRMPPES